MMAMEIGRALAPGDCLVTLGAGNIHEAATMLARDVAMLDELQAVMGAGMIKLYEPLAKHTTMRVGGPAQFWAEPETEEGFARLVRFTTDRQLPLFVIGRGSNLLVRDGGMRGVVVHLQRGEFKRLEVREGQIIAGVGVKQKELAYAARDAQIGGFEWFEGIPGNVGGALRMNAGAHGRRDFPAGRERALCRSRTAIFTCARRTNWRCIIGMFRSLRGITRSRRRFVGHASTAEEIEQKLESFRAKAAQPRSRANRVPGAFSKIPHLPGRETCG